MKKSRGTILIDLLLAMSLSIFILGIFSSIVRLYSRLRIDSEAMQNRIGLVQLQYYLMAAYDFQVDGDELRYMVAEREYVLRISNRRLIQQPGTLIFLLGIEDCEFSQEEEGIEFSYVYREKSYKVNISYQQ